MMIVEMLQPQSAQRDVMRVEQAAAGWERRLMSGEQRSAANASSWMREDMQRKGRHS
jgi:hypothetical protein